jgi:hypothetical protein
MMILYVVCLSCLFGVVVLCVSNTRTGYCPFDANVFFFFFFSFPMTLGVSVNIL